MVVVCAAELDSTWTHEIDRHHVALYEGIYQSPTNHVSSMTQPTTVLLTHLPVTLRLCVPHALIYLVYINDRHGIGFRIHLQV